jgi:hypothetical protein
MPDAYQHHQADQTWAMASAHLEVVLDNIREQSELVATLCESHDPSALFDFVFSMLRAKNRMDPSSFLVCELVCAAALTRLASVPKADDPLEKMINDDPHQT